MQYLGWLIGGGGGGGGRRLWWWFWGWGGVKSEWDCRKVEADSGDFQRSVGDRSVGKVWQVRLVRRKAVWAKRGRGDFNFVEVDCRLEQWPDQVGTVWSGMGVGAGSQMGGCQGSGC